MAIGHLISRNTCFSVAMKRHMRGQSMVELCVAAPVVFFMILVTIQFVLLYRIKATLDYATLQAARAGAVSGADHEKMRDSLERGMTPLFTHDKSLGGVEIGYFKAVADMRGFGAATIDVINPTKAAWDGHKEKQYNGQYALPNDNLAFRDDSVISAGVNVQDANLLKIRVIYDAELIVPFVKWVFKGGSKFLKPGAFETSPLKVLTDRLPIEAYAIVRMQSPIYDRSRLDK